MGVAIVQTVTNDPAPSNIGNLGAAGDTGGQAHICIASSLGFQAGNYLLAIGETANFAGTTAVKFTDPVNGDWATLEHLNCRSAPGGVTDGLDVILASVKTSAIAAGFVGKVSASGAGTATCTRFDATAPDLSAFVGATFTEYSTGVTGTVSSVTGASNNVLNFSGGGTPPVGNPMVVGGFVKFVNTSAGEDYTAATIVEVSGAAGGLIGHSSNQNTFAAAATLSTGTISAWTGNAMAISFGMDDEDNGASPFNPISATGTDDGPFWVFNLASGIMRMQHEVATSPAAPYGMNFTTRDAEHHLAFLAVFQENPASAVWQKPILRHPGRGPGKGDQSARFYQAPRAYSAPATGLTLALTGQAATFSAGALTPSTTVPMVGQASTFSAGTLVPSTTVALLGQAGTFTAGTLTPSTAVPLVGQSATFSAGTVVSGLSISITGSLASFNAGLLVPSGGDLYLGFIPSPGNPALSSPRNYLQFSRTNSSITNTNVTAALTGLQATFSAGLLTPSTAVPLTGQPAAFVAGTMVPGISIFISGSLAAFNSGLLVPSGADSSLGFLPFPGSPSLSSPSNAFQFRPVSSSAANPNVTASLSGQSAAFIAGSLTPSTAAPLAGSAATFTAGQVIPGISVSLVGQAVTFSAGSMTPSLSAPLVGQPAALRAGVLSASGGDVSTTQVTIVYFIGNVGTLMGRL